MTADNRRRPFTETTASIKLSIDIAAYIRSHFPGAPASLAADGLVRLIAQHPILITPHDGKIHEVQEIDRRDGNGDSVTWDVYTEPLTEEN